MILPLILVDTSIWIDYLRTGGQPLAAALEAGRVCMHPWVIGELACGNLANRQEILGLLQDLPRVGVVTDDEALFFIEHHQLMGRGIGFVDVQLLAAATLHAVPLWTRDKRLGEIARELGLAHL